MEKKEKPFKKYFLLYIKGLGVGVADSVPGISGGTIAFITGIYEELIDSLRSFTPKNLKLFFTGKLKAFWKAVNGNFLLLVALGIGTGLFSLARIVLDMLDAYPVPTWSFFFGLIVISTIMVFRTINEFTMPVFIAFGVGAVVAYLITVLSVAQTPNDLWFIFICGMVACCIMILPGISGGFVLLLMGKYQYMLGALYGFKIEIIATFASGAIIGLLTFSHLLSWMLRRYHDLMVALLAGFMFGALNKVWPWKVQTNPDTGEIWSWNMERFTDHSLKLIESNHLPQTFEKMTKVDANLYVGLAAAALAIAIFLTIDIIGKKMKKKKANFLPST
jgi:putative membrane protein